MADGLIDPVSLLSLVPEQLRPRRDEQKTAIREHATNEAVRDRKKPTDASARRKQRKCTYYQDAKRGRAHDQVRHLRELRQQVEVLLMKRGRVRSTKV